MKKSFYISLFIILLFALDQGAGFLIELKFDKIDYGIYGKINRSLNSKEELLVLGSSRAQHHYVPSVLSDNLDVSVFNAGLGGYGLFYNYPILKSVINTSKPKIVILDISPNVILDPKSYTKLNFFLPYVEKYSSFNSVVQLNPDYSKINLVSKLYRYNSTLYDIVRAQVTTKSIGDGYTPLYGKIDVQNYIPFYITDSEVDRLKVNYFERIINLCVDNNVQLFVMVSPTFEKYDSNNRVINLFEQICIRKHIKFYDYSNCNDFYGNPSYFHDQLHMNSKGAKLYSQIVAKQIRPVILKDDAE